MNLHVGTAVLLLFYVKFYWCSALDRLAQLLVSALDNIFKTLSEMFAVSR